MILAGNIGARHTRLALFDETACAGLLGAARIARREPPHIYRAEPSR